MLLANLIAKHTVCEFADDVWPSMYSISAYKIEWGIYKIADSTNKQGFQFGGLSGKLEVVCGLQAAVL